MPIDWNKATPEQIEKRNAQRRERYSRLNAGKKAAIIAKASEYREALPEDRKEAIRERRRIPDELRGGSKNFILHTEGQEDVEVSEAMTPLLNRLKKKIDAHKIAWAAKCKRIIEWREAGEKYPWPSAQDKMVITELFAKIMHIKGRRCCQCGCYNMWDFSWRITRKDDFWAFQPFQKKTYENILRDPAAYDIYCLHCAWDLSIYTFYYIFGPRSPRNEPTRVREPNWNIGGPRYANWDKIWPIMYPPTWEALSAKIKRGEIKSMSCTMINAKGQRIDTFLKKKGFHTWVKNTPRDFNCMVMEEVGQFYMDTYPAGDWRYVGWNDPADDLSNSRRREPKLMTDDLKRWLLATPMGPHMNLDGTWNQTPPQTPVPEADLLRKGIYI